MDIIEGQMSIDEIKIGRIDHEFDQTIMSRNEKELMYIPADGSYVEILGHRLDGDFKNFEGFCEYIHKVERTESNWNELKEWLVDEIDKYEKEKWVSFQDIVRGGAMKKLLEKMEELEGNG